jgi:drug/metabolite transporter (DMT)-like permease
MIAVLGGLGAALLWGSGTVASARSSRVIGPAATLGWVMVIALAITVPAALLTAPTPPLEPRMLVWLTLAGLGNVLGLLLVYRGLRIGKIGIVTSATSTEGAVAAVIAVLAGATIAPEAAVTMAFIVLGVVLAASSSEEGVEAAQPEPFDVDAELAGVPAYAAVPGSSRRAALHGLAAAAVFGIGLYARAEIAAELPLVWAVLPAPVAGTLLVALPLAARGRMELSLPAVPLVLFVAFAEVVGTASFAFGARENVGIAAVLASQFAVVSAVLAYFLFGERLTRLQRVGVFVVAVGVAVLTALQAA